MSTRSQINVKVGDKYHSIYCHFDGYLSHVGSMLLNYYNSQELAEKLVSNGDMSSMYASCEKPEGHSFERPIKGYCVYYGRDRGESGTEYQVVDKPLLQEFTYVWTGDHWEADGELLTEELIKGEFDAD